MCYNQISDILRGFSLRIKERGKRLSKGKKYSDETRERALALLAVKNNVSDVAKELKIPEATLRTWRKKAVDEKDGEFAKARALKKQEFVDKAWSVAGMGLMVLERRMQRALEEEHKIDMLADISLAGDCLGRSEKQKIAKNVAAIRCDDIAKIGATIGILCDKQAQLSADAAGKEAQVVRVIFANPEEAAYAE